MKGREREEWGKGVTSTLESSRRAFSRRSGLLSSRTSCSAEAILRSLLAAEPWAEEFGDGGTPPPPKAAFIDRDWGRFDMSLTRSHCLFQFLLYIILLLTHLLFLSFLPSFYNIYTPIQYQTGWRTLVLHAK